MYKSFSDMYDIVKEQIEWKPISSEGTTNEPKALDENPMKAVEDYLRLQFKQIYVTEKRKNNHYEKRPVGWSVPSIVAWVKAIDILNQYVYYKIIHSLHGIRHLDKLKNKINDSYKREKISQQQYEKLEYDISLFYKKKDTK
ncbi:MAG: hypothetical protein WBF33_09260 [Candidatus Nitrosopolaris sp.]